jgi:hypothetical protein
LRRLPHLAPLSSVTEAIGESSFSFMEKYSSIENYVTAASVALEQEYEISGDRCVHFLNSIRLLKTGLFDLEARAMVDTWSKSYFLNEGMRVIYIAPRSYPNMLLPWCVSRFYFLDEVGSPFSYFQVDYSTSY